jgi:hypothetical protein
MTMSRILSFLSLAALVAFGSACWDTPFHGSHIAKRNTPVALHGFVPVPHGAPVPTTPIQIYARSSSLVSINLSAPPAGTTVSALGAMGLYDWYEVSTSVVIPNDRWFSQPGHARTTYIQSNAPSAPGFSGTMVFFEDATGTNCFQNRIANNLTYDQATNECVTRAQAFIYADAK